MGFQEIVELSPQQIMSTDPAIRQAWERAVKRTLNDHAQQRGAERYILLRSGQLVGAALSIFVKKAVLPDIKNVEGSVKKVRGGASSTAYLLTLDQTGLSGMAGNKGAVAIRMDYANTQICFVTAHLAAGFANYEERNRDYQTINHGLRFQRNRTIENHDTVIWLGDFNYRIGLGDDRVRRLIQIGDLDALYENDQVGWRTTREAELMSCPVESADGGRSDLSILLRSQDHFPANVQIQQWQRCVRYFVSWDATFLNCH